MIAVIRAVGFGILVLAVILHVVGFATNTWISVDLPTGIPGVPGMSIRMGLWKYCLKNNMGGASGPQDDAIHLDSGSGSQDDSFVCQKTNADSMPSWMKAVQALGILSLLMAVATLASMVYGCFGDVKGDRARLFPYIVGGICLGAGLLLLIGVIVYGSEYNMMMQNQMSMLGGNSDPVFSPLVKKLQESTVLGYSFALEAVAAVLMVLVSAVVTLSAARGWDDGASFRGGSNLAV